MGLTFQQNGIKNPPISAFDRFEAHFSTKLNTKPPLYRPLADLGLIFQKNKIKNIKSPFIGLRPIWGSFSTKLNAKYEISCYRPPADLRLIFELNLIQNPLLSAFGRLGAHLSTNLI